MNAKNSEKMVVCKGCGCEVKPRIFHEPNVYVKGVQISGKYYRGCPECLKDVESGEDRQDMDFCKGRYKQLQAIESSISSKESRKTFILEVVSFIVGLVVVFYLACFLLGIGGFLASICADITYWFKGTKLGYWYYMNHAK